MITCIFFIFVVALIGQSNALCCKNNERRTSSCTVCPAHWYTSCPSGYSDVGSEGCGFLGCRIKCKCSQVCGCYDSNNNQDHAKCQRGGDTSATCNDGGSTTTSYTCQCSTGFYDHNGNCVDYNACEGGQRSCRDGGDSSATCVDLSAPSTGFACACSAGFHDDGGVCTSNKCTSLALLDGMIGSGGDNKCVNGLVLDAVYDTNCEYTCVPGFTGISTGGSAKFSCGINGGTATTSYQCTENQCHTLQLGMNVEGSSNGAISACTESQQLSSVTYPSCGITCSDGYFDNAATKTKVSCLTTGGATVPTIIASVEESTCNDNELENTVDGDALTYWRPTTCLGNTKIMYSTGIHFQLTYVRLDSIFDGLNGVTKFNVHACDTSSIESATCVLQKECTISATNSNCDVSDSFNVPTRFVMIEITETESSSSTPYIIGVELFESFSCQSWSNCEPGTYVAVQPTNQNDRVCISCPSGYTSVGLNAVSCVEEDGCVNPDACGEHGTCVDNQPPHDGYSCSCETGYHEQSGICVDVNSCSSHTCGYAGDINAMCVDHVAPEVGFTCVCSSGYVESGAVCVNENGCDSNPCQSEGDENAVCHDTPAPGVGNTCSCSDMFVYEASMDVTTGMTVCSDIDGCETRVVNGVTFEPCKQHGDADAICFDLHVPNRGNGCSCSVGYHSETNTYTFETECVPDSCEGNPLIDHIDMNGPCDVTPSGSVCVFDCAAGYKSSQAVLCDLGVFQIDSSVSCLDALEVTGTIENIIVEEDATISDVELSQLFSVSDDAGSNQIQIYVHEVSPADIVSASITSSDNTLRLSLLPDANGIVNVTIRGQVGNNVKDVTFQIHVTAKNDAPRVANPVAPVTILEDSNTYVLSLSDLFEDVENDPIVLTVTSMMTTLLDVVILNDDVLYVTPKPDQNGETDITIRATTSNDGVFTETSIHFTVTAQNDDITLNRTLASVVIYEDSEPLSIDLTHVFVDVDNSVTNINASVSSSSPQHLLHSVNVQAEILMLSVEENLHGDATIRLVAFSEDGSEIYHDVNIIVESVDDAPVVAHPVADQLIDEDSGDHEIDLSNVFMDLDSEIVISVSSNSAPAILLAVVESTTLTLKPQSNQHGECMITLHAQAGDKYVETVFQVVIVPTDDGPVVARGISPIEMFEDADSMLKPLSGSFVDADGDEVGYLVVKCERFSSLKKCNDDDTTTLSTSEVTETECRILCATTMLSQSGCCTFDGSNCVWSSSTETITSTTTNSNLAAVCSNTSPLWSKFATIEILGTNTLQVSPIQNKFGNDTVELIVSSDYAQTILTTVPISVLPVNDLIALNTTLSNLAVYEDAAPMTIRNIIVDVDNDLRSFTASSSNENLVSVSVIGDSDITMSFSENLSGQAVVTVQAESEDNSTITHEIVVIVLPVDDAPVVLNPILDQTMLEDAPPMSLSLINVFQDIDSTIELIEVFGNSNPDILSASIQSNGKFLVMTPVQDRSGFSDITLRALSQTQSAFLTFRVIVTSVDDAPKIVNQVSNQVMVESGANLEIDLSNVFIDLEGDEITIVGAVSTPLNILDLSMSSSNNNILTLSPIKDANGVVVVVVTCVANSLQTSMEFEVDVVPIDTAPRTDETKMNLLMDAASEASSCDIDDVCTWTYENAADVMYDVDSSDMLLSVTCLDSTHVKSIEIDSDTNVMKMTYTTDDMPLNYTVICTITAQADEKMHSAEFTKQFLGNGVDSSSSSSSTILGLDNDQTVMASTALAILVLILLALFVYYRRRVKKREAAMDRVVKRAEAELISIASKAWLEDDLNMMDDTDIGLDSVTSIESMAERQNRLQSHIESLKQDNKRMKENVEVLSNRLTNQDSLHQGRLILDADIPAFPPSENLSDL